MTTHSKKSFNVCEFACISRDLYDNKNHFPTFESIYADEYFLYFIKKTFFINTLIRF